LNNTGKAAALKDYLTRLAKAQVWANAHKDQYIALFAKATGLPVAIADVSAHRIDTTYVAIDAKVLNDQQKEADAFSDAKVIPSKLNVKDFFDTRYSAAVAAAAKEAA
jgi:sulfonate transport system substrate-binding protein